MKMKALIKRILCTLITVLLLVGALTGCGTDLPRPEVREGRFDFSVTYEHNGVRKTVSDVYVCKYVGIRRTVEGGAYRAWSGRFEGEFRDEVVHVCNTDDGGEISIVFRIYPEYFMGEPDYKEDFLPDVRLALEYRDSDGASLEICEDKEVISGYGVRIVGYEYGDQIENTFK